MAWFIVRSSRERIKHVLGLTRAGAYVLGLGVVLGAVQIRIARAEIADRTVQLGREMMTLANASEHEVNKVSLNGQTMWLGNSLAHDTAKTILDRYESHCQTHAAQPAESWRELATKDSTEHEKKWFSAGVLRGGDDREGTVVCFTKTSASKRSIVEAAKSFAETGDLGSLGAARYVYAKTTENGNTHVLTAWTDDTFSIFELVGDATKDVAGADFGGEVPRVPDSRRAFAARLDQTGFGVNVYQSSETDPGKIARFYDDQMQLAGWTAIDPELTRREPGEPCAGRVYEKDNVVLTLASVRASQDPKEGTYTVLGMAGVSESSVLESPGTLAGAIRRRTLK